MSEIDNGDHVHDLGRAGNEGDDVDEDCEEGVLAAVAAADSDISDSDSVGGVAGARASSAQGAAAPASAATASPTPVSVGTAAPVATAVNIPSPARGSAESPKRLRRVANLIGEGRVAAGAKVAARFDSDAKISQLGSNDIEVNTQQLYAKIATAVESSFQAAGYPTWSAIISLRDTNQDAFMFEMKKIMVKIATASITGSDSPLKQFSGMIKRKFEVGYVVGVLLYHSQVVLCIL